ncbi:GPI transamidase component PIG-T [Culicoides brevitarsis]|uniref:GPI transamidase component PIG-T n=1 Tax=Culicoides brevitarsis TaxID=469753 RepID=UPI00307B67A2
MLFLLIFCAFIKLSVQNVDIYDEELYIKPLKQGFVNTYFQFTTRWNLDSPDDLLHTHLTARPIAEIFRHYPINELHVSLTSGLWKAEKWGYPVIDAPAGAEIWAWFRNESSSDDLIDDQWKSLCGTLSGLLCASLSFVDDTNTLRPEISLKPQFYDPKHQSTARIRYATLPREIVCTENLTPWKKFLPCSYKEGLASLLTPEKLYSTNYHSLGIHVRKICDDKKCESYTFEIRQTVNLVHDLMIFGGRDWSIRKFFGQGINGMCPLAESSKVYVDTTEVNYELTPVPHATETSTRGGATSKYAVYDVKRFRNQLMNIAVVDKSDADKVELILPPPIFAKRSILGVGQERGKIVTKLTNKHWGPLNVVLLENVPWFVPIYLHTLKLKMENKDTEIKPTYVKYIPGEQRARAYHLEVAFTIPSRSTVEISIDFDYIFLKWQEYPPDANHGHYIGAAVVSVMLPIARNYTGIPIEGSLFADSFNATRGEGYFIQLRTEILLITLPTPDFSMPYNVICLACTVVALAFGPIHNMSTKKIVLKNKAATKGLLSKLKEKFFKKKEEEKPSETSSSIEKPKAD